MLLSEQELRAALEPLLDRLLIERLRYFQLQLEPKLRASLALTLEEHGIGKAALDRSANAFRAGAEAILRARDVQAIFGALFEASTDLVGEAHALLVSHRDQTLVWKSAVTGLPERIPAANPSAALQASGTGGDILPVVVRGVIVGWLYWEHRSPLNHEARARVEMMLQVAGLALLGITLATLGTEARSTTAVEENEIAPEAGRRAPRAARAAGSEKEAKAIAFAELLIEDMEMYLQRERHVELDQARREGVIAGRFENEIGRCRRAYFERFPGEGSIWSEIFEEAVQRL